jgi:hypothetical protein
MYYNMPWEYKADELGGVNRNNYTPSAKPVSDWYFELLN